MFLHIQLDFMDNLILLFFVSSILYSYNLFCFFISWLFKLNFMNWKKKFYIRNQNNFDWFISSCKVLLIISPVLTSASSVGCLVPFLHFLLFLCVTLRSELLWLYHLFANVLLLQVHCCTSLVKTLKVFAAPPPLTPHLGLADASDFSVTQIIR